MKILYLSKSIIPSRTANSINVMKMSQAFADNGHEVVLLAPNLKNKYEKDVTDIYEYYGVKKNFKIKKTLASRYNWRGLLFILLVFFFIYYLIRILI